MNVEEMYNAINKGIPNLIRLELPIEDLIKYWGFHPNSCSWMFSEFKFF